MSITIYNYIDPNAYKTDNQESAKAKAKGDSTSNNQGSDVADNPVEAQQTSFEQTLVAAKRAIAAVAIDNLVRASNTGQIDSNQVQQFFDQHSLDIQLSPTQSGNTTDFSSTNEVSESYSNAGDLSCSDELERIFEEASSTYGVDIKLLKSIGKQESNYDPNATSHSGAMGVMQLMPAAAQDLDVDDAYDPYQNIMGGAKLISKLLDKYNGDKSLALAAYNAGSGNVDKYGGIPPFTETQNYVEKVLGYYNS